jgi:hypothetical protein
MFSRTHAVQGNETYRFSSTYTLSDFPLLIGGILRRSKRHAEQKARARSLLNNTDVFKVANIFLSTTYLGLVLGGLLYLSVNARSKSPA